MRGWPAKRLAALVALAGVFALGTAAWAHAQFSITASAGPLTVSTATLGAPAPPGAAVVRCGSGKSVTVLVYWDEDDDGAPAAALVTVLRASSPSGPWTMVASGQQLEDSMFDTVRGTVYYAVELDDGGWQSPLSAATSAAGGCHGD